MEIGLDRPWDRLITERIQLLSGWIRNPGGEDLSASRGDREIALRSFPHPLARDSEMQGFYGFLALQEFLPWVRQGRLRLQLRARSTTRELHLRVSPLAEEAAQESPLDLNVYPM